MQIKKFTELSPSEIEALYGYITRVKKYNHFFSNLEEMIRDYQGLTFNKGENIYITLQDGQICGTIGMITKDIQEHGKIFLSALTVAEEDLKAFPELLKHVELKASEYRWKLLQMGIPAELEYLVPLAEEQKFTVGFRNVHLWLPEKSKLEQLTMPQDMRFEKLAHPNKEDYLRVHNDGFRTVPTGAVLLPEEVEDLVKRNEDPKALGVELLGYVGEEPVMILTLENRDGAGWIDGLAIAPDSHGRGYGKYLLKYSVERLQEMGAETINLVVTDTNTPAYRLYERYGFELKKVISIWLIKHPE